MYSQAERCMPKGSESSLGYKARACLKRKRARKYQEAELRQPLSRASKSIPQRAGPGKAMGMRAFFQALIPEPSRDKESSPEGAP